MACGVAGLAVAADSLSAVKHTGVEVVRDETGLAVGFRTEGEFPAYGNDDDRADSIAVGIVERFMDKIERHPAYRGARHTLSVLTITSNVVYGHKTGDTPDGRPGGTPFSPGANPMNGRDTHGLVASALSVAKLGAGARARRARLEPGRDPGRFHRLRRIPHERQRAGPGHARRRDGAPGEVPAAHDPGLRLRGELRPPDPRAAAGRPQPHVPRVGVSAVCPLLDPGTVRGTGSAASAAEARPRRAGEAPDQVGGFVHSWDVSTGVDGPGTRFVVFTAGCPLRCRYCQNPETWRIRDGRATGSAELVARAAGFVRFITASGGGATVSGGEPLLQPRFTGALLRGFRDLGLHTALDTSGYLGARADDGLLAATSLVLLDIKSWDRALYQRLTGRDLHPTLAFARRLAVLGIQVHVRFVLVPGLTDGAANVRGVARFAASLGNVDRVDVLPFHKIAAAKYGALGMPFPLAATPAPTADQVRAAREIFTAEGLTVY
jgi:pyruvate formate lyase activating enzyme